MREGPDLDSKITSTSRFAPVGAREDREAEASGGRSHRSPRDRLADAACVGVALLLGGLFILGSLAETPPQPVQPVWELVVGGSACAALLLLRRRWPVGLALVLIVASPLSALGLGAALMAVFTVATRRSWRVSAALGGLLTAVFMSSFALATRTSYEYWSAAATVLFLLAALLASGMLVRPQRLLVRSLQEWARQADRGGPAAPRPGGAAAGAGTDRQGDARRARPPHLAADPARRRWARRPRGAGRPGARAAGARPHTGRRLPASGLAAVAAMTAPVGMLLVDDAPLVRAGRSILLAVVSPVRP
jgi:hypothetical protein